MKRLNVVNLWFMHKSSSSKPLRLLMENLPVGWGICLGPGTRGGAGGHAPLDTGNRVISSEVKAVVESSAMKTSGWKSKQHTYISWISGWHWCLTVLLSLSGTVGYFMIARLRMPILDGLMYKMLLQWISFKYCGYHYSWASIFVDWMKISFNDTYIHGKLSYHYRYYLLLVLEIALQWN